MSKRALLVAAFLLVASEAAADPLTIAVGIRGEQEPGLLDVDSAWRVVRLYEPIFPGDVRSKAAAIALRVGVGRRAAHRRRRADAATDVCSDSFRCRKRARSVGSPRRRERRSARRARKLRRHSVWSRRVAARSAAGRRPRLRLARSLASARARARSPFARRRDLDRRDGGVFGWIGLSLRLPERALTPSRD